MIWRMLWGKLLRREWRVTVLLSPMEKFFFNDENRSRWIQSQNVSLQFQVAHDLADQRQKQYQHV
eukprot:CCRYP_015830-RA/>CCRYP_015830-RA protein AED:0.48 eAED:0.48 QI:0/0/0/1/0/0/2/0/64